MAISENNKYIPYEGGENVTVPDLQKILGTSETSLVLLCRHRNIVKEARRKPYDFGGLLVDGLYGKNGTDESIVLANNFGMAAGTIRLPHSKGEDNSLGMEGETSAALCVTPWTQWHAPTSGSVDHMCRRADFRGYDARAIEHIAKIEYLDDSNNEVPLALRPGATLKVRVTFNKQLHHGILLSEFKYNGIELGNLYLTILAANYIPYDPLYPNTTATWAGKLLVSQSDQSLGGVIDNIAGLSGSSYTWESVMDMSAPGLDFTSQGIGGLSSNLHFIAIGLAPLYNQNWVGDGKARPNKNSSDQNLAIETGIGKKMPFDLVNIDAWNSLINKIQLAAVTTPIAQRIYKYFYIHSLVRNGTYNSSNVWQGNYDLNYTASFEQKSGNVRGIRLNINDKLTVRTWLANNSAHQYYINPDYINQGQLAIQYDFEINELDAEGFYTGNIMNVGFVFVMKQGFLVNTSAESYYEDRYLVVSNSVPSSNNGYLTEGGKTVQTTDDMAYRIGQFMVEKMEHPEYNCLPMNSTGAFVPCLYQNAAIFLTARYLTSFGTAGGGTAGAEEIYWPIPLQCRLYDSSVSEADKVWHSNAAPIKREYGFSLQVNI